MRPAPEISTYLRVSGKAPREWLAMFDGLPMFFIADTERAVVAAAHQWWTAEQEKIDQAKAGTAKAISARRQAAA